MLDLGLNLKRRREEDDDNQNLRSAKLSRDEQDLDVTYARKRIEPPLCSWERIKCQLDTDPATAGSSSSSTASLKLPKTVLTPPAASDISSQSSESSPLLFTETERASAVPLFEEEEEELVKLLGKVSIVGGDESESESKRPSAALSR